MGVIVVHSQEVKVAPDTLNTSLVGLVEAAIDYSKTLKNQQLELDKLGITQKQIYHTYIPKIEAGGTYAYSKGQLNLDTDPIPFMFPGTTLPIPGMGPVTFPPMEMAIPGINTSMDYSGSLWMGGLTAKWTLFTGLKVPNLGKAMEHKIKATEYLVSQSEADIIEQVAYYYDMVALLAQSKKVIDESEKRLERESAVAQKALSEGLITQHKYQKIEIARLTLASKQIEYNGKRQLLHLKLQQLTGLSLSSIEQISVELKAMNGFAQEGSYLNRPEIKALDEAIVAGEYKLKSESSGYLPKVQAFASHQYAGFRNGDLGSVSFNEVSAYPMNVVGVGFKWELFDGFHTQNERKKAKIDIMQTQNKRTEASEMLMLNYSNTLNNYQVSTAQESLRRRQQETAKKSMQISYREYQNGLLEVSEFLEAQTDYETSVLEYYQTVFEQRQSVIRLMNAIGELNLLTIQTVVK